MTKLLTEIQRLQKKMVQESAFCCLYCLLLLLLLSAGIEKEAWTELVELALAVSLIAPQFLLEPSLPLPAVQQDQWARRRALVVSLMCDLKMYGTVYIIYVFMYIHEKKRKRETI